MAKVITFFGADSQVGCTMTAASCAQALKLKKNSVLLVLASSQIEEGWFGASVSTDLGVLLRLSAITKQDVLGAVVKTGDFDFIRGSHDPLKKQWFDVTTLQMVIEAVTGEYDYIVIDGGYDVSLPLSMSALFYADRRFYVFNGSEKSVSRFITCKNAVIDGLGLDGSSDRLILNKDTRKTAGTYDIVQLQSKIGMEGYSVPMYENAAVYEFDRICPYSKAGSAYQKAIGAVAEDIIREGR